jgi:thioredoxin-related protein
MILRLALFFILLCFGALDLRAAPEYPAMGPDIFDRQIDGEVLLEQAIVRARQEDKRIIVLFGANWCPWCRRMHRILTEAPAVVSRLRTDFVLVYVDANFRSDRKRNWALLRRFGDPIKKYGLPVLVVLDRNGTQLTTQETNGLAAATDEETMKRILHFLARWAPPR